MTAAAPVDSRGQRTVKECPGCHATLGRTATKCGACGHSFIRHPERLLKKPGRKPGPPAKIDIDAPETDSAIDRILAAADTKRGPVADAGAAEGGFTVGEKDGAATLDWTAWGVKLPLTAKETAILRKALT